MKSQDFPFVEQLLYSFFEIESPVGRVDLRTWRVTGRKESVAD